MKLKYIQKSDLGDIMTDIAEQACEHPEFNTHMVIRHYGKALCLNVQIISRDKSCTCLVNQTYQIIDDICDGLDVMDETINAAITSSKQFADNVHNEEGDINNTNS